MPQVLQCLGRGFAAAQEAAHLQLVHELGCANRGFGQELGAVEQEQQQLEHGRIARPGFVKHRAHAVSRDVTVEPHQHAIGIGQRFRWQRTRRILLWAKRQQAAQQLHRQIRRARRYVNVARTRRKGFQQAKRFGRILERMRCQQPAPFGFVSGEVARQGAGGRPRFRLEQRVEILADVAGVLAQRAFERAQRFKAHQRSEALARFALGRDRMRLQIVFHLQPVLDVAQETVGFRQFLRRGTGQEFVLDQLVQRGECLRVLKKGDAPGVEELDSLGDEFDLPNPAAAQLDVPINFAGLDHFVLGALLHLGDFAHAAFGQRARVAKGLNHFDKLGGQRGIAGYAAGFAEHHALPGLTPLRIIVFVAAERPRQRARLAFRTQTQIDPVQSSLRRQARHLRDQRLDQPPEELVVRQAFAALLRPGRRLFEGMAFLGVNEYQIDIGTVVQFLPAQFAQPQHAKFRRLPPFVGIQVPGLAEALGELPATDPVHGLEADIGHAGNLLRQSRRVAQPAQVSRRDAEHFALFELAQLRQGCRVIARLQHWTQPGIDLPTKALFLARMAERLGVECQPEPIGMFEEQFAQRLRSAEQRRQDARLLRRGLLQRRRGRRRLEPIEAQSGPRRIGACFNGLLPHGISHG